MITFLLGLLCGGIVILVGLFFYQKKHIRDITDEKGDLVSTEENPLLMKNINSSQKKIHLFLKEEAQKVVVGILRVLIFLKKKSRTTLDKGITKLAHVAFPEEKITGPIDENTVLFHVENQKKDNGPGRIE